ncbi:MAG: copper chaperone PCu(A)C, partial [Oceanicaulis sp.]
APALALGACSPGHEEPGELESELEQDATNPGDAVDPSEIRSEDQSGDGASGEYEADGESAATLDSGEDGAGTAASGGGDFTLSEGWVRNPVGGRDVTAGFFTLRNNGAAPARLVSAQSPEAERVELHTMAMEGDVMRMRRVEGMDVPAGGELVLQSGGDHLMIFGLPDEAAMDGELELVFTFEDGRTLETSLPFADTAPRSLGGQDG